MKNRNLSPFSRYIPALVLFVLSPFIAEILLGATTISHLDSLLPITMLYGGGAVVIRELARRRGSGWSRIIFLGMAYALIEEGLVFQTMFNPDLFNAAAVGGRFLSVNWIFFEWVVVYHVIWSILIPIALTETLYPARRAEPLLGRIAIVGFGVVYALGALAISFFIRTNIAPGFQASSIYIAGTVILIVAMVLIGVRPKSIFLERSYSKPEQIPIPPSPWLVGFLSFLAACAWFGLLHLPTPLRYGILAILPILLGCALIIGALTLLRRWAAHENSWTDVHRLTLIFGPMLASMLNGFFFVTANNIVDQLGQGIASAIAITLFAFLVWIVQEKEKSHDNSKSL